MDQKDYLVGWVVLVGRIVPEKRMVGGRWNCGELEGQSAGSQGGRGGGGAG